VVETLEFLRFGTGLIAAVLGLNCIVASIDMRAYVLATYPGDVERAIMANSWVRSSVGRFLTSLALMGSGWLLIISPTSQLAVTWQGWVISIGWVVVGFYMVSAGIMAHVDRHRIRSSQHGIRDVAEDEAT